MSNIILSGGTVRLPRLVGPSKAKELIFTGKALNSSEAQEIGMVDYSVEQNANGDAAYERSLELASEMLERGPVALKMAKKSINKGIEVRIYLLLKVYSDISSNSCQSVFIFCVRIILEGNIKIIDTPCKTSDS